MTNQADYNKTNGAIGSLLYEVRRGHPIAHLIDRVKWNILPKLHIVPDFPTHVDIEVSANCPLQCPMCRRRTMPENVGHGMMEFDLYKKIIDECAENGVYSVKLSWRGEPLTNPNIIEMIRYAKEKGIKDVAFLTSGFLLSGQLSPRLIQSGLDWISLSIDGVFETYDRIRYPSKFYALLCKIKYLKEFRDDIMGLKKPLIRVQTIYSAIKDNPDKYFEIINEYADQVNIIADQSRADYSKFPWNKDFVCYEPWQRMVIGWNGKVPCCISDYDEMMVLGDVTNQSIQEIWHSKGFGERRTLCKRRMNRFDAALVCNHCHDAGEMYEKTITISGKERKINLYKGQEN